MKKILLLLAALFLMTGLGLRGYYTFVPPPEATLVKSLTDIVPAKLNGWSIEDHEMADSEESSARISDFLNFDDALYRTFKKGDAFVGLYIAYWRPGKASYRWAGAHTPDTCWVLNGWTRLDRKYSQPLVCGGYNFKPAEFGIYEKDGSAQNVHFWHLVGGEPYGYSQKGIPNILGALLDVKKYGMNLREEQFFIRLSSNKSIHELEKTLGFQEITASLHEIGLLLEDS